MTAALAHIAANRFGLGSRPGELAELTSDPLNWLRGQIGSTWGVPAPLSAVGPSRERINAVLVARAEGNDVAQAFFARKWSRMAEI